MSIKLLIFCLAITSTIFTKTEATPGFPCLRWGSLEGGQSYDGQMFDQAHIINSGSSMEVESGGYKVYFDVCRVVQLPAKTNIDSNTHPLAYAKTTSGDYLPLTRYIGGQNGNTEFKFNIIKAKKPDPKKVNSIHRVYKKLGFLNVRWNDDQDVDLDSSTDDLKGSDGLKIDANNTNVESINWNLQLSLMCDSEAKEVKNLTLNVDESNKLFHITLAHKDACGYDVIGFQDGLGWFQYVVEGTLIAAGLFICFFGLKMWKPSIAIIGFLVGACASFVLISLIWNSFDNSWKIWLMLGLSLVLGILCAVLVVMIEKIAMFLCAGFLGFVIFGGVYNTFISQHVTSNSNLWFTQTVIAGIVLFAVLAIWLHDQIIILSTSICGGFVFIGMIGNMIGNYPNPINVSQDVMSGKIKDFPWEVYMYFALSVAISIIGLVVQFHMWRKDKKEKQEEKDHYARLG